MATGSGGLYTNGLFIAEASDISGDMLFAVDTQSDGGATPQSLAVPLNLLASGGSVQAGLTAEASGVFAAATALGLGINELSVVAGAADGAVLPYPQAGNVAYIANNGAAAAQIFVAGGGTLNGTAGATGVSQANGSNALYFCAVTGAWERLLGA